MAQDKCVDCEKPLGGTEKRCFECGGSKPRGQPIGPEPWQVLLIPLNS